MQIRNQHPLRTLLLRLAAACALLGAFAISQAQTYPSKPIRLITFNSPGGAPDLLYRIIGEGIAQELGQPVVVENRPGAGGAIAVDAVATSAPDGYTIGMGGAGQLAVGPALRPTPFDPLKSFSHVSLAFEVPLKLWVSTSLNLGSVQEFVALAKAQPGKLNYGSYGAGTTPHLGFELFKLRGGGIDIVHIPYKADTDIIQAFTAGDIQATIGSPATMGSLRQLGKVRMLATTGATRDPEFPEVPTLQEAGIPGVSITSWGSVLAPAGTPREIVLRLNRAIITHMAKPDVLAKAAATNLKPKFNSPDEITAMVARDFAQWKDLIEKAHLKVD